MSAVAPHYIGAPHVTFDGVLFWVNVDVPMIDLSGSNLRGSRDVRPRAAWPARATGTDSPAVTLHRPSDDKHNSNTDSRVQEKGRLSISDTYITDFIIQ